MRNTAFSIIVEAREWVLAYTDGTLTEVLAPGRHKRTGRTRFFRVSQAEQLTQLAPQEIPTLDGIQVKASAAVRWKVVDPVRFHEEAADPEGLVYLAAQVALRVVVSEHSIDDLGQSLRGDALGVRLRALVAEQVAGLGIEPVQVVVRDFVLPAELRHATLELAAARARGQAQLEAARAETAAIRSLANGAKLLDEHPALAQLRIVQALPPGSAVTVALPAR